MGTGYKGTWVHGYKGTWVQGYKDNGGHFGWLLKKFYENFQIGRKFEGM